MRKKVVESFNIWDCVFFFFYKYERNKFFLVKKLRFSCKRWGLWDSWCFVCLVLFLICFGAFYLGGGGGQEHTLRVTCKTIRLNHDQQYTNSFGMKRSRLYFSWKSVRNNLDLRFFFSIWKYFIHKWIRQQAMSM